MANWIPGAQARTEDGIEALYEDLQSKQLNCLNSEKKFIHVEAFDELITVERVLATVGPALGTFCARYWAEQIVQRAKKTLAILVLSGCEAIVYDLLVREGMTDAHLPLSNLRSESRTLDWTGPQGQREFKSFAGLQKAQVNNFCGQQWLALAPEFDGSGDHKKLCSSHPLPFLHKHPIASTKFSNVFSTKLHPAHYNKGAEKDWIEVAVKELVDREAFEQEQRNLTMIGDLNNAHLIKHIATYEVQNPDGSTTYSIIFPLASGGNLDAFWDAKDGEPRTPELIQWSLEQILGLATAVRDLHKGFQGDRHCRHGDLKPLNILLFKDTSNPNPTARGEVLAIGDLGISKFHDKPTWARFGATLTRATTPDYEPPEARGIRSGGASGGSAAGGQGQSDGKPWSRKYDIWSLACVFLEFALWLSRDGAALHEFRLRRDPGPFYEIQKNHGGGGGGGSGRQGKEDGEEEEEEEKERVLVSEATRRVIEELQGGEPAQDSDDPAPRAAPGPLRKLVDFIEQEMLVPEVEGRCDAERLVAVLEGIVEEARRVSVGNH